MAQLDLGEGFNRKDTHLIQQIERFFHFFEQQERKAYQDPNNVELVRKFNEESINLVYGFRNFKRNLLIIIINCKVSGLNILLLVDHIARPLHDSHIGRTVKSKENGRTAEIINENFKIHLKKRSQIHQLNLPGLNSTKQEK